MRFFSLLAVMALANASSPTEEAFSCDNVRVTSHSCTSATSYNLEVNAGLQHSGTTVQWSSPDSDVSFASATNQLSEVTITRTANTCPNGVYIARVSLSWNGKTKVCETTMDISEDEAPELSWTLNGISTVASPLGYKQEEIDDGFDEDSAHQATAVSSCGVNVDVVYTQNQYPGPHEEALGETGMYHYTRVWTARDACGNENTHTQILDVFDATPPEIEVPDNVITECDSEYKLCDVTATDNSGEDPTIEFAYADSRTEGCPHSYTAFNTWTATDANGNKATETQTVRVVDTVAPVLHDLPSHRVITVECDAVPSPAQVRVTDACDNNPTLEYSQEIVQDAQTKAHTYTLHRKWAAADACGNSVSFTQTMRVQDQTAPTLTPEADETQECGAHPPPPCAATIDSLKDNCDANPSVNIQEVRIPGSCSEEYDLVHTYAVSDASGNTESYSRTVTVVDNSTPTLQNVPNDVTNDCSVPTAPVVIGSDICWGAGRTETAAMTENKIRGDEFNYAVERVFTLGDECGNTVEHRQTIEVVDTSAPQFIRKPQQSYVNIQCHQLDTLFTDVEAEDNCCEQSIVFASTEISRDCANKYSFVRNWTTTDCAGNPNFYEQVVDVSPAPAYWEGLPLETMSQPWEANLDVPVANVTRKWACDDAIPVTYSQTIIEGSCDHEYNILRTWTADDGCNEIVAFTQTISVYDTTKPTISVVQDKTADCSASTADSPEFWGVTATESDGSALPVEVSCTQEIGSCDHAGQQTCQFTAVDVCGNTATSSAVESWSDNEAPSVTCDGTFALDQTPSDTCDTDIEADYTTWVEAGNGCDLKNTTWRSWQVTDACGNVGTGCTQFLEDFDLVPPTFTPPADETFRCRHEYNTWLAANPGADINGTDDFDTNTINFAYNSPSEDRTNQCDFTIVRSWTGSDCATNPHTDSQTITVRETGTTIGFDREPEDTTVECHEFDPAVLAVELTASTGCADHHPVSPSVDDTIEYGVVGVYVLTWSFTETGCYNIEHKQTVTVVDTTDPLVTVDDTSNPCSHTDSAPEHSDSCGAVTCVSTDEGEANGSCYAIARSWTCTDQSGNSATAVQTLTAVDSEIPSLVGPDDATEECGFAVPSTPLTWDDDCGSQQTVQSVATSTVDSVSGEGTITLEWNVQDTCGKPNSATQVITVKDSKDPTFDSSPVDDSDVCGYKSQQTLTASDECSTATVVPVVTSDSDDGCSGTRVITYTATDEAGRTATTTQTSTYSDLTPPSVGTLPSREVHINWGQDYTQYNPEVILTDSTDACSSATVSCTYKAETLPCAVNHKYSCSVHDDCSNSEDIGTFVIVESDDRIVQLNNKPENTIHLDCSEDIPTRESFDVQASVGTLAPSTSYSPEGADAFTAATCKETIYKWQLSHCGESDEASVTIVVHDTTAPVITLPNWQDDQCVVPPTTGATATDDCAAATIAVDTSDETSSFGTCGTRYVRTSTAADACGNTASRVVTINVEDTVPPTLTGLNSFQSSVTVEAGMVPVPVPVVGAFDNCQSVSVVAEETTAEGSCDDQYDVHRTWTATDACGLTSVATQTVHHVDTVKPDFSIEVSDDFFHFEQWEDNSAAPVVDATDASGVVSLVFEETTRNDEGLNNFTVFRSWTATDRCGNTNNMEQEVTVVSPFFCEPPNFSLTCDQADKLDTDYAASVYAANCTGYLSGDVTITVASATTPSGVCDAMYTVVRTYTIVDSMDNSIDVEQTITVFDSAKPFFADEEKDTSENVTLDADQCDPVPPTRVANDLCSNSVTVSQDTVKTNEQWITTYIAVDECGLQASTTHTQVIIDERFPTWVESLPPSSDSNECSQPTPDTLTCVSPCGKTCTVTPSNVQVPYSSCPSIYVREWDAIDSAGFTLQHTQSMTVTDMYGPTVTADAPKTCDCNEVCTVSATALDSCDGSDLPTQRDCTTESGDLQDVTTCVFTYTDTCGATDTDSSTVTYVHNVPAVWSDLNDQEFDCAMSDLDALTIKPTATDHCDGLRVVTHSDEVINDGSNCADDNIVQQIIRTYSATDNDNAATTISHTITIVDNAKPQFYGNNQESYSDQCDQPVWTVTAGDDCHDGEDIEITPSKSAPDQDGKSLWTYTHTDTCGKVIESVRTVTVYDYTDPVFDQPSDETQLGCGEELPPSPTYTATDNCGPVSVTYTVEEDVHDCSETTVVHTWTATDSSGNSAVATYTVYRSAWSKPVCTIANPSDTAICGTPFVDAGVQCYDTCTQESLTVQPDDRMTKDCNDDFVGKIYYESTSAKCNLQSDPITFTGSRSDTEVPTFDSFPPDQDVTCDVVGHDEPEASDNCDNDVNITVANSYSAGSGCTKEYYTTYRACDNCGQCDERTHLLTVTDEADPVFSNKPAPDTLECNVDPKPTANPDAVDDCDGTMTVGSADEVPQDHLEVGKVVEAYTREWSVTSVCGQTSKYEQTVTIQDTTPPVFIGYFEDEVIDCADFAPPTATATDVCHGTASVVKVQTKVQACGGSHTTVAQFTATDASGNVAQETKTITVVDLTAPKLQFSGGSHGDAADVTIECVTDVFTPPTCSVDSIQCDGEDSIPECDTTSNEVNKWLTVYTYTASDSCGNRITKTQSVTTVDTTPPTIDSTNAQDRTLECLAEAVPTVTANDVCGSVSVTSTYSETQTCGATKTGTWVFTARDEVGLTDTHTVTYTWNDNTPPTITVTPATGDDKKECDGDIKAAAHTVDDACSTVSSTITSTISALSCEDSYLQIFEYNAVDDCSNQAEPKYFTVTVDDTTKPTITANPSNPYRSISAGPIENFPAMPTIVEDDNCDLDVTTEFEGTESHSEDLCSSTHIRKWTASDNCGNSHVYSETIDVTEDTQPAFDPTTYDTDITVECGNLEWLNSVRVPRATDRQGHFLTVTDSSTSNIDSECSCKGTHVVTFTASDCGQTNTVTTTVHVVDTTPPAFVCVPDAWDLQCSEEVTARGVPQVKATDASSGEVLIAEFSAQTTGTCDQQIVRTYRVSDCSDNVATYEHTISVRDTTAPSFARTAQDISVECGCDTVPPQKKIDAIDNCESGATSIITESRIESANSDYQLVRTYTAEDSCGMTNSMFQTISVVDTTPPTLVGCEEDKEISCEEYTTTKPEILATDECDENVSVTYTEVTTDGSCPNAFTVTRTWSAADVNGNTASESQVITVFDDQAPQRLGEEANIISCLTPTNATHTFQYVDLFPVYDNCGITEASPVDISVTFCNSTDINIKDQGDFLADCDINTEKDAVLVRSKASSIAGNIRTFTIGAQVTDECGNAQVLTQDIQVYPTYEAASAAGCTL